MYIIFYNDRFYFVIWLNEKKKKEIRSFKFFYQNILVLFGFGHYNFLLLERQIKIVRELRAIGGEVLRFAIVGEESQILHFLLGWLQRHRHSFQSVHFWGRSPHHGPLLCRRWLHYAFQGDQQSMHKLELCV